MGMSKHTAIVMKDGSVKMAGQNNYGQLALGSTINQSLFVVPNLSEVKQVVTGYQNTLFLMKDGTVKVVGYGQYGQLGYGGNSASVVQIQTLELKNVKAISSGLYTTMFLMEDGTVKACGSNELGQFGNGTTQVAVYSPINLPITNVKQISCGLNHTMFLLNDGTVRATGKNDWGQLGSGDYTDKISAYDIKLSGVKKVACGGMHTLFLMEDGTVKSTGNNYNGQVGDGSTSNLGVYNPITVSVSNVKDIDAGYEFSILVLQDGSIMSFGKNNKGQLSRNSSSTWEGPGISAAIANVKQVYCGYEHVVYLLNDGSLKTVGDNEYGQLALGDTSWRSTIASVTTNLGSSSIEVLQGILAKIIKYLIQDGETIKIFVDGSWINIGTTPLTKEHISKGMTSLEKLNNLNLALLGSTTPELLAWYEEDPGAKTLTMNGPIWEEVSTTLPSPEDMVLKGMPDLKVVPPEAWADLGGDFEVVTYTNDLDETQKLFLDALPKSQLIAGSTDFSEIAQMLLVASTGVKVVASSDAGVTWKALNDGVWQDVRFTTEAVKASGMSVATFNLITADQWKALGSAVRFAYLLEGDALLDKITVTKVQITDATPSLDSMQVEYEELTLEGRLKDLERLNAINLAKLNFKANALLLSDSYKLDDMVVDTFEKDSIFTALSGEDEVAKQPFSEASPMGDGFYSEATIVDQIRPIKAIIMR